YQLAAGAALPPLVVDDEEALALALGLQAAAQGGVEGVAEAGVRALAKVVQVMPARLRRRLEALRAVTVPAEWPGAARGGIEPDVITVVALACRDSERLRFGYTAAGAERTDRHVEPHRLVTLGRRWYLVAYDLNRHDWRSFRLDRVSEPHPTGARFRPRDLPAANAAEFVRARLKNLPGQYQVDVLADVPAATARERIGQWSTIEEVDAGHCRVRMTVDNLDWPTMALGVLAAGFHVQHPPELTDRLRAWADRFAHATAPDRTPAR
ncbi:WYL domain-containing protein, partial [Actinophytocola sp.]|uniref:helix-turn-helix transcriptional regulator n=1 Tax=Actinophytocola sp. TaxID=1872138 RepID=UPI002D80BD4D